MKAIIFAGGVGTRLWPLSRKKSPKQFEHVVGNKSTLQLTYERLSPSLRPKDIFITTGINYVSIIRKQLPKIPKENIIGEPEKKDVGPAVALMAGLLSRKTPEEPMLILWSDHLIKKEEKFKTVIKIAGDLIKKEKDRIIFIGQKPRFPSENLGWIELGDKYKTFKNLPIYYFERFKYRPSFDLAKTFFSDGKHCWNLGYFVSTPVFILKMFKRFAPKIYQLSEKILTHYGKKLFKENFIRYYDKMPEISFDNAILEQLDEELAYVIAEDIGWSDVGAWEALKEALQEKKEDNITLGKVHLEQCFDNLVYNYESKKLLVGIDLNGFLVINAKDVLLVAKKTSVPKIKEFVKSLENTKNSHLT
jgi:mannose-1-phosphate guanylyltransferase